MDEVAVQPAALDLLKPGGTRSAAERRFATVRAAEFDDLDEVLFDGRDEYSWSRPERDQHRLRWIKEAVAHHLATSPT